MDLLYIGSLVLVAIVAFSFNRNNSPKLMLLALAVGAYIIYSHETGNTASGFKDSIIQSIDKSAEKFVDTFEADISDEEKAKKEIQK